MALFPSLWTSPFGTDNDLHHLHKEMERFFENDSESGEGATSRRHSQLWRPRVRSRETPKHHILSFDIPGVKKDDIQVEVYENQLLVSAERREESQGAQGEGISTFSFGTYYQAMTLPPGVDPGDIEAHYEDGVLHLAIPKTNSPTSTRKIEIKG